MFIFSAVWAVITNQSESKQITLIPQKGFYSPQISTNCLACPKGVKYKRISNKQAVSFAFGLLGWYPAK